MTECTVRLVQVVDQLLPDPLVAGRFFTGPDEGPFVMVNLLRFRDRAEYHDGSDTHLSGREAYDRYAEGVRPLIEALGGRVDVILRGETSRVENRFGILALIDRFRARDVRHVHLLSTRDEDGRKETASTVEIWYDDERKPGKRKHARLAVPKARRWWLAAALRDALTNNDGSKLR